LNAIELIRQKGKEECSKNCRKRVIDSFDSNDKFREYIDLYRQFLNS